MGIIAYALNLIDLSCTLRALRLGCVELNPLMRSVTVMVATRSSSCGCCCGGCPVNGSERRGMRYTLLPWSTARCACGTWSDCG